MAYGERPWDNPINWSFRIGRLFGIDVRVHIAFILCAAVLLAMEMPKPGSGVSRSFGEVFVDAFGTYGLLFFIVLVHEFGHCFGARAVGGEADEILLWPLGGLATTDPPHNARAYFLTAAAGPAVNVIFCVLTATVLIFWTGRSAAVPLNPFHPFRPIDSELFFSLTAAQFWAVRFFGLSYLLLLFNLLPILPLDGGQMLQSVLWSARGYRKSMEIATATGMVGAIVVGVVALFIEESWLLLMIAVFGYLT
ncbi:MAG: hypothetical protein D6788_07115, partial [Planctomycetota bacterium]